MNISKAFLTLFRPCLLQQIINPLIAEHFVDQPLAMMSLVDNNASKELTIAVRDEMRPNIIGQHYNDRNDFYNLYKSEKYNWIENSNKDD